jgi:hypothetical protein
MKRLTSMAILAIVAIAAVAAGVFVVTRGPGILTVTTPAATVTTPTATPTTPLAAAPASCFVGYATVRSDLTNRPFTIQGPEIEVLSFPSAALPRDASISVTVLTADSNEVVARDTFHPTGGAAGETLKVQTEVGTYYLEFAAPDLSGTGGYHLHVF